MPFIQWRWAVAIGGLLIAGIGTMLIRSAAADRPSAHWDPARADAVPTRIGDWRMVKDVPPDQGQMQRFKRLAAVERVYSRGEGGPELVVFLVYGNTMEAMHFPEHCLRAGGWGMSDMHSISVPAAEDGGEAFDATLIKAAKHPDRRAQQVFFFADAHTTSADWLTLVWRERRADTAQRVICMVIIVRELPPGETEQENLSYLTEFAAQALPHVQETLRGQGL